MTTLLFPRGRLAADEEAAQTNKKDKKSSRKRSPSDAEPEATPATLGPLEAVVAAVVRKAAHGKPARLRPVRFASYHAETSALGVVRSATAKHALVSLPGNLVGHVALNGAGALDVGAVVACSVLSTSRAEAPGKKRGAKRVELSVDPRGVQRGVRLEDLAAGRVATVGGIVASKEARGYVVDLGVSGATGFLNAKHCAEALERGATVAARVRSVDAETGVVALAADDRVRRPGRGKPFRDANWFIWGRVSTPPRPGRGEVRGDAECRIVPGGRTRAEAGTYGPGSRLRRGYSAETGCRAAAGAARIVRRDDERARSRGESDG